MGKDIMATKEPKFQEISFAGNMPSQYEKDLRKAIAKSQKRR